MVGRRLLFIICGKCRRSDDLYLGFARSFVIRI